MSTPAEEQYDQSASFFVSTFKKGLTRYGWWYSQIKEVQLAAARGIDEIDEPYVVRERMMRSLDLCTRLLLLNRRATGYGLLCSVLLNCTVFWDVPLRLMARYPTIPWLAATVLGGVLRIALLWVLELFFTLLTSFSGWFRRELIAIKQEAEIADQATAEFRQDLTLIGSIGNDNAHAAAFLLHHVRSHRPS